MRNQQEDRRMTWAGLRCCIGHLAPQAISSRIRPRALLIGSVPRGLPAGPPPVGQVGEAASHTETFTAQLEGPHYLSHGLWATLGPGKSTI